MGFKSKIKQLQVVILLSVAFLACGSSSPSEGSGDPDLGPGVSALGSQAKLAFQFSIEMADGEIFPLFVYPNTYEVPLYFKSDGQVFLRAVDFPRMVLRTCPMDSTRDDCDVSVDAAEVGEGVDLVMDLCGRDHSKCLSGGDNTIYEGSLTSEGRLFITGIDVRVRVFVLGTSGPDGFTADDTDEGLLPDLPRLEVVVQTDPAIDTGVLSGNGERVTDAHLKLVAGGIIPDDMPEMGGAHYIAAIEGDFDIDPLSFLD